MSKNIFLISTMSLSMWCLSAVENVSLEKCFEVDSISCVQIQIYQSAKNLFNKANLGISEFVNLSTPLQNPDHKSRSLEGRQEGDDDMIIHAGGVEQRQILLEKYFGDELINLWSKVSISGSKNGILRYILELVPTNVLDVDKGRSNKQKKSNEKFIAVLVAVGVKLAILVASTYMTIAAVATKALLAGSIALVISGFILIKNKIKMKQHDGMKMEHVEMQDSNMHNAYAQWARSNVVQRQ